MVAMRPINKIECVAVLLSSTPHTVRMSTVDMRQQICEMVANFQEATRERREDLSGWANSRKEIHYVPQSGDGAADNILRDKKSGWNFNYYESKQTIHDVNVANVQASVNGLKRQIKEYDASLDAITEEIENSKRKPEDPKFKKLTQKEVEALEAEYIDIYKRRCERMVLLDGEQETLAAHKYAQMIQRKRFELLHALRNNFMNDGDERYLRAGTTWVENYINELRK